MHQLQWSPEEASALAERVDALFLVLLGISLAMALLLMALVVGFAVKYRKGSAADRRPAKAQGLEYVWMGGLLALFAIFFVWAAWLYVAETKPPASGLEIVAIGKQWMWEFQHPTGQKEINQLHLPANTDVKLVLATQDVIHSFFVPAFRIKQDVVPGRYTATWFRPIQIGRFHLFCAEYCGLDHARMGGWVTVMEPAQYQAWLDQEGGGASGESLAAQGKGLFSDFGCKGCHGTAGVAPSLAGIVGETIPLQGGKSVIADENYLRESILYPSKEIVAGYAPIMPSFAGQVSEGDLLKLIAYIKSLSRQEPAP